MEQSSQNTNPKEYFYGFDYLKAFFIICIVAWHSLLFGNKTQFSTKIVNYIPNLTDIIYFNIITLAVPVFIQISLFLYVHNRSKNDNYFMNRILYIGQLFVFWSFAWIAYRSTSDPVKYYFSNIEKTFLTVITGGNSIFYFFFSLLLCTLLLEGFMSINEKLKYFFNKYVLILLFIFSLIILLAAPHLHAILGYEYKYWNPINFIPYVFSTFLIIKTRRSKHFKLVLLFSCLLYLVFSTFEWLYLDKYIWSNYSGHILPGYTRISFTFGAMFLVVVFSGKISPPHKLIRILSQYSLGIYCFHMFSPFILVKALSGMQISRHCAVFIDRMVFSIIATYFFKKIKL